MGSFGHTRTDKRILGLGHSYYRFCSHLLHWQPGGKWRWKSCKKVSHPGEPSLRAGWTRSQGSSPTWSARRAAAGSNTLSSRANKQTNKQTEIRGSVQLDRQPDETAAYFPQCRSEHRWRRHSALCTVHNIYTECTVQNIQSIMLNAVNSAHSTMHFTQQTLCNAQHSTGD